MHTMPCITMSQAPRTTPCNTMQHQAMHCNAMLGALCEERHCAAVPQVIGAGNARYCIDLYGGCKDIQCSAIAHVKGNAMQCQMPSKDTQCPLRTRNAVQNRVLCNAMQAIAICNVRCPLRGVVRTCNALQNQVKDNAMQCQMHRNSKK